MKQTFLLILLAAMACAPLEATAQSNANSYPMETVRWDNVPAENREMIEQLFADMILVPEGGEVKKFYISLHDVQKSLWVALMGGDVATTKSYVTDPEVEQFISILRKQTGKRFRTLTKEERYRAMEEMLIVEAFDIVDSLGKGFRLALDTIAKAEQKMLVITATDGTQTKYLLEGMPRVNIEKPYLVISSDGASVSLPLEQLQHIHYEKATDEATAIEEIKMLDERNSSERIDFSNLPAGATASIYTTDGKLLYNLRPTQGKTLSLPLGSMQSGIYLVKVNDVTYKIQKP